MIDWTRVREALIAAVPPTLAVIIAARKIGAKVDDVHTATNSIVSQLVDSTAKASKAEGVAQGTEAERQRARESTP